jgi:co-chaperonin GroES (HSP10)
MNAGGSKPNIPFMTTKEKEVRTYPRPIRDNILIERNRNSYHGKIAIPELYHTFVASDCLVLDKGDNVYPEINIGDVILHNKTAENKELWKHPEDPFVQLIKNHQVFAVMSMDKIIPLGNNVLLERFTKDSRERGILIPDSALTQSLMGRFISRGVPMKPEKIITSELKFGDKVKISKWNENHHEINYKGHYYVIIPDADVEYHMP